MRATKGNIVKISVKRKNSKFVRILLILSCLVSTASYAASGPCDDADFEFALYVNGASVGDASGSNWVDAFTSLKSAVESAKGLGGSAVIYMAEGNYRLESPLILGDHISLVGVGNGENVVLTTGNVAHRILMVENAGYVKVENLSVVGGRATGLRLDHGTLVGGLETGVRGGGLLAINSDVSCQRNSKMSPFLPS